ncbi:permease [Streptomyces sp. NPDC047042]|uniref:permease n=1 Tax=Streptomyces sp. NPDC047042 TaxID=3154807 RepID=UPI003411914B
MTTSGRTGGRRLSLQLVRMGFAAGRGTPGDRLRFWSLCAAALAVAVVALAVVAAVATHDGRDARNTARGPLLSDRQHAVALWREAFDVVGEVQHSVIYVERLKADAPPPPGLSRWPAPGEAMLSPELLRDGQDEGISTRYGRFAGTIAKSGLVSPSERLAYVGVRQNQPGEGSDSWWPVSGFGQSYPMGETLNGRTLADVLRPLGALTGVPALALLVVAARVGSRTRDRRAGLLQALGGTWRHRALVDIGEAALPLAAGTALAGLVLLPALLTDVRLPPTGYLLDSGDLRTAWPGFALALLLSFVGCLLAVILLHRVGRDGTATRPRSFSSRVPRWRLVGCGVGVAAIALSQYAGEPADVTVFTVGTVLMWVMLPSVAAVASRALGEKFAVRGFRAGRAGQLIGGRWTAAHPGVVVRISAAMIIGLGLVCQLEAGNSRLGDQAAAAQVSQARVGAGVLSVQSRYLTPPAIEGLARALPANSHLVSLQTDQRTESVLIQGSCATLRSLALPCPAAPEAVRAVDPRVAEIANWFGRNPHAQVADPAKLGPDAFQGTLLVVTEDPEPGLQAAVEQAAYARVPGITVETLGENWTVGAADKARLGNWVLLFGSTGLALLLLTGSLGAAAEFVRVRSALAPLAVLTGSDRIHRSVAFWHLTVPLLIATVVAAVVTAWQSLFFTATEESGTVSWAVFWSAVAVCALLSALIGALAGRTASRAATRWHPTAD